MGQYLNNGIENIEYNVLNLPKLITFANGGTIRYTYSATGEKLKAEYTMTSDSIIKTTDYCGNVIYQDGRRILLIDGGYVTFNDNDNANGNVNYSSPTGGGREGASYHYYLKDHLGNNRVVVNENDSIEQVNHYYPYGGLMAESTGGDTQRYKYNGKELDRMHGLDWYDYGARWMNGLTFTTPDPKAWDYTDVSPYVYCMDNPINAIDVDGKDGVMLIDNDEQKITIKADYYVQTSGRISANRSSIPGYTKKEISGMNDKINRYLNDLGMSVSEGEYAGYLIQFDLKFVEGGNQIETKNLADNDFYENMHIGNTFSRWDSTFKPFIPQQNEDGTFSTVGGITANNTDIIMNVEYDSLKNRIHEIFHSFGFRDFKNGEKGYGIMNYPPLKPNQRDANNLIYSSILQIKK